MKLVTQTIQGNLPNLHYTDAISSWWGTNHFLYAEYSNRLRSESKLTPFILWVMPCVVTLRIRQYVSVETISSSFTHAVSYICRKTQCDSGEACHLSWWWTSTMKQPATVWNLNGVIAKTAKATKSVQDDNASGDTSGANALIVRGSLVGMVALAVFT